MPSVNPGPKPSGFGLIDEIRAGRTPRKRKIGKHKRRKRAGATLALRYWAFRGQGLFLVTVLKTARTEGKCRHAFAEEASRVKGFMIKDHH